MARFAGKVALVTGGTSGIGRATVLRLAAEGAKVVFTGSKADAAAEVCAASGAAFQPARVENEGDWAALSDRIARDYGRLDIAFANAGMEAGDGSIESITRANWDNIVAVNLTGVMLTAKAAVALMRANPDGPKGAIIINSSMSAYRPMGNFMAYSVTKGALIALMKSIALHCAQSGTQIRCCSVHPGVVETEMITNLIEKSPDPAAARAAYNGMAPLRRMARVEEVAALVAFLSSDEAAFISGTEHGIDGGSTAGMMGVV